MENNCFHKFHIPKPFFSCNSYTINSDHLPLYDDDWDKEITYWDTNALYPYGSANSQLISPHFEEQLDIPVAPQNNWYTSQTDANKYIKQTLGVHGTSLAFDPSRISPDHISNPLTPSSNMETLLKENFQETYPFYPALHTNSNHHQIFNDDWSQGGTHWNTNPYGLASHQTINTPVEEDFEALVPPETWHSLQKDVMCVHQNHGFHQTTLPPDRSTISSNYNFNPTPPSGPCTPQNIFEFCHEDGLQQHQNQYFGQVSHLGMREPNSDQPRAILERNQKKTSDLSHISQTSLERIGKDCEEDSTYWGNLFNPDIHDMISSMPLSSNECDLLGLASPRISSPTQHMIQQSQLPGQEGISRSSDEDINTVQRIRSTDPHGRSQGDTAGAFDTSYLLADQASPSIHHKELSKGRKRLLSGEKSPDKVTKRAKSLVDNSIEIEALERTAIPRQDQNTNPEVQGVMNNCIGETFSSLSGMHNCDIPVGPGNNQDLIGGPDTLDEVSKHSNVPLIQKKNAMTNKFNFPGPSTVRMLKDIGAFHVANSPRFAFEVPNWFRNLRDDMMKVSGQEESMGKDIHKAIEGVHWWLTMSIFGLISIHCDPGLDSSSLDTILDHAWKAIQAIFDQWRYFGVEEMKFQYAPRVYERKQDDLLEPLSLFRYFVRLNKFPEMTTRILQSIIVRYNKDTNTPIVNITKVGQLQNKVKSLYNKDIMFIQGGLYSRASIGNLEFEGTKFHNGYKRNPWVPKSLDKKHIGAYRSISRAAKFLSPAGTKLCQRIHSFFVELIEELLNKYKSNNELHSYSTLQIHLDPTVVSELIDRAHESNMETIVKAVSVAEYRITVGFIGVIRSIYEQALTEAQLNILIESGWQFLQKEFSNWKLLSFEEGKSSIFFTSSKTTLQRRISEKSCMDPNKSFEFLCKVTKNLANYPIPLTYFNMLMRSWFQEDSHEQLKKIIGKAFSEKMRTFNSFIELLGKPEPKHVVL
ncbi:uncharacterized protein MELLADRAFT_60881 [Melampsora larici-populina 98AG31]|uniref:Uncharacterized protein n=1 Tax=Melampsora larici-populina (strain 98AG31 / pathotype 3-4-7) TaxID=747676 RepID=F4RCT2_MELLP|nr:uncharacterized protein MELLADRAFT_60881 [Melampsora larici-populina 98AG31]EGG09931.1 hypothetical protein MELLADRAFT_60881 [Melampsora larici-populina 98AG31]